MTESSEKPTCEAKRRWEPVEIRDRGILGEVLQTRNKTGTGVDIDGEKDAGGGN